jgi:hypothetical protein
MEGDPRFNKVHIKSPQTTYFNRSDYRISNGGSLEVGIRIAGNDPSCSKMYSKTAQKCQGVDLITDFRTVGGKKSKLGELVDAHVMRRAGALAVSSRMTGMADMIFVAPSQ